MIAFRSMLVTCIDSSPQPARLGKWVQILEQAGVRYEKLRDFVWIHESDASRAFDCKGAFVGFDEVYLLKKKLPDVPVLTSRFTSDGTNFEDGLPDALVSSLTALGADGYLADGCGVNFAIDDGAEKLGFEANTTKAGE